MVSRDGIHSSVFFGRKATILDETAEIKSIIFIYIILSRRVMSFAVGIDVELQTVVD